MAITSVYSEAQGPNAEGGQHNYVVKDWMIRGFGLVAFPAHYGVSGIHTFIVNQDGVNLREGPGTIQQPAPQPP